MLPEQTEQAQKAKQEYHPHAQSPAQPLHQPRPDVWPWVVAFLQVATRMPQTGINAVLLTVGGQYGVLCVEMRCQGRRIGLLSALRQGLAEEVEHALHVTTGRIGRRQCSKVQGIQKTHRAVEAEHPKTEHG